MVCSCLLNSSHVLWFVLALNMNFLLLTFEDQYENHYTFFSFHSPEIIPCPTCVYMWYDGLCSSNRYRLVCVLWHICQWMYCLQEHAYQYIMIVFYIPQNLANWMLFYKLSKLNVILFCVHVIRMWKISMRRSVKNLMSMLVRRLT